MSDKALILGRIREVWRHAPAADAPVERTYQRSREVPEGVLERFVERVEDYRAQVVRTTSDGLPEALASILDSAGATRVGIAQGLPAPWREAVAAGAGQLVVEPAEVGLEVAELQTLDAVVTGVAVGVAETGTVVLDGSAACGRRALTLVPDRHLCLVLASQIVDDVPAAIAQLRPAGALTWISGPSATSDIELNRVEGVHGPRNLHVVIIEDRGETL